MLAKCLVLMLLLLLLLRVALRNSSTFGHLAKNPVSDFENAPSSHS